MNTKIKLTPASTMTFLLHGFNVKDRGHDTTSRIVPFLKKVVDSGDIINQSYGYFNLWDVLWKNKKVAKKLTRRVEAFNHGSKVMAVGHSNGCAIINAAAKMGAHFDTVLLINPALNVNTKFPPTIGKIIVLHTKHDKAVRAARFFDAIPFVEWLVPDSWGAMGAKGATRRDRRVININTKVDGHSSIFSKSNLSKFGPMVVDMLYSSAVLAQEDTKRELLANINTYRDEQAFGQELEVASKEPATKPYVRRTTKRDYEGDTGD